MATIHKVDTIELLQEFVLFIGLEVNREMVIEFLKQRFPEIENHETDIWNLIKLKP